MEFYICNFLTLRCKGIALALSTDVIKSPSPQ